MAFFPQPASSLALPRQMANKESLVLSGLAGLITGAMFMAVSEYVSVKSQQDTEDADLKMEAESLKNK